MVALTVAEYAPDLCVHIHVLFLYSCTVHVAVTELRAHLSDWLDRAGSGEEVVVTDHGVPVARIVGVSSSTMIDRLTSEGVIARAESTTRPKAAGRRRVRATADVAELVSEQRR